MNEALINLERCIDEYFVSKDKTFAFVVLDGRSFRNTLPREAAACSPPLVLPNYFSKFYELGSIVDSWLSLHQLDGVPFIGRSQLSSWSQNIGIESPAKDASTSLEKTRALSDIVIVLLQKLSRWLEKHPDTTKNMPFADGPIDLEQEIQEFTSLSSCTVGIQPISPYLSELYLLANSLAMSKHFSQKMTVRELVKCFYSS